MVRGVGERQPSHRERVVNARVPAEVRCLPPTPAEVPGRRVLTLKVWSRFFDALCDKDKTFEVRRDDRGYKIGDVLHLCEYDPQTESYSGYACYRVVTYVLRAEECPGSPIAPGFVVLGLSAPSWLPFEQNVDDRLTLRCSTCKRSVPTSSLGSVECRHDGTFLCREM